MNPAKLDTPEEHPSEEGMEVHPAIALLIGRMESHPEEFFIERKSPTQHFPKATFPLVASQITEQSKQLWNRKEKRLYNIALRKVRLEEAHQRLMKALLAQ